MQDQHAQRIVHEFAEYVAPDDLDLWPAIRDQIRVADGGQRGHVSRPPGLHGRVSMMMSRPHLRFTVLAIILIVVFGVLVEAPVTRAALDAIVRRFGISFVDTSQMDNSTGIQADATSVAIPPSLSLAEAQRQVPFHIRTPGRLPDGLTLVRAIVSKDDMQMPEQAVVEQILVSLLYEIPGRPVNDDTPLLMFEIISGPPGNGYLLAASREQQVTIQGQPAIYVHGGWRSDGQGDPKTALGGRYWDDALDSAWLSWQADGLTYRLAAHNLGLSREDVLQIGESLQ